MDNSSAKKTLFSMIDAEVKTLPPEETFILELKQTVQKCNPPERGSKYYKPSSMNCDRGMFYIATETDPDDVLPDYNSVRITESGSSSHERIQYYVSQMRNRGFDCDWIDPEWYAKNKGLDYLIVRDKKEFETKFLDTRYNLSFLCDGIIRYKGKYYILEIKTETDYKNMSRKEADSKHRNQAVCYSIALGINDIMWIYESRNVCNPQVFHTSIDPKDKENIIMRIEYVDNCVKDGVLPPQTEDKRACQYCQYKSRCARNSK